MSASIQSLIEKVPQWRGKQAQCTPLSGGITNQNFRVDVDGASHVLRVCSPTTDPLGIRRDHEHACLQIVAELGIGPDVTYFSPDDGILVVEFVEGKAVSAEDARQPDTLQRIVAAIRTYHDGPEFPGSFSAFQTVRNYHALATEKGVAFPDTLPQVFEIMERIENSLSLIHI